MIIKTFKEQIKGVIGVIYVFGEEKFRIGSEGSSYEFPTENLDAFIKALKLVKRYSKKSEKNARKPEEIPRD